MMQLSLEYAPGPSPFGRVDPWARSTVGYYTCERQPWATSLAGVAYWFMAVAESLRSFAIDSCTA